MENMKRDLKERYSVLCRNKLSFDIHGLDVIISCDGRPIIIETNPYWYSGKDEGWDHKLEMFKNIMNDISR